MATRHLLFLVAASMMFSCGSTGSSSMEVTLCTINSGHVLYADAVTQGAAIPDVAWEAFARQTLP
jgi:hypothetical protein